MITLSLRHRARFRVGRAPAKLLALLVSVLAGCAGHPARADTSNSYTAHYRIDLSTATAAVALRIGQQDGQLKRLTLVDGGADIELDASQPGLERVAEGWLWHVPSDGGVLRWRATIDSRNGNGDGGYTARWTHDWAVLRAEDVIPPIATVTRPGADAATTMRLTLPRGWSSVTPYRSDDGVYQVEDQGRRFDRPDGWILAGDIGVRRDLIANTRVAIAAPRNQRARRLDAMALLNWHLPLVRELLPDFPDRLLVAMADDPFFRGGLSAPNSLFLHSDRPLLSGNGTSTLLHELFHVGFSRRAVRGEDWIIEGLAEYYSQHWLWQSGTVTTGRHEDTLAALARWGKDARRLPAERSSGARTALAVTVFAALDDEIRSATDDRSLDDVVRRLAKSETPLGLTELRAAAREILGRPARSLRDRALKGY